MYTYIYAAFLVFSCFKHFFFTVPKIMKAYTMTTIWNCLSALFPFPKMAYKVPINFHGKMTTILKKPLGRERYLFEVSWKQM